jgi:hypothetical protein
MRQLVAIEAFAHAVRSVRGHIAVAFAISLPWLIILLAVSIGRYVHLRANLTGSQDEDQALAFSTGIPLFLILMFAFCSIAVNWHRFIFMDEVAAGAGRLRADAFVWRYFGNFLLITLLISLAVMAASLPLAVFLAALQIPAESLQNIAAWPWPLRMGVQFVIACLVTGLFFRLAVKLPAIALGRRDFRLGNAWSVTRGNTLNLLALAAFNVLAVFAAEAVSELLGATLGRVHDTIGSVLPITLGLLIQWLVAILGTTILTSLYGYFVEKRDF